MVSPQGKANVFVDGEVKGTTPLTLQGKAGKRLLIILEREGFKPGKASVKFPRKGERRVEVSLEKKKRKKKVKKKEVKKKETKDDGYDDGY